MGFFDTLPSRAGFPHHILRMAKKAQRKIAAHKKCKRQYADHMKQIGGRRRKRRTKNSQLGGRRKSAKKGGIGAAAIKGTFAPAIPDYGITTHPFHVKYTQVPASIQKPQATRPMKREAVKKTNANFPTLGDSVSVVLKGKPLQLLSKGRRVAVTTR